MEVLDLTIIEFDLNHRTLKSRTLEDLDFTFADKTKIYWIHCNLEKPDLFNIISQKLMLPDELLKLCHAKDQMPKVIDADETVTIQVQCLESDAINLNQEVNFNSLIIHLTNHFCFTASRENIPALSEFLRGAHQSVRYAITPCFVVFLLLDIIVNDYAKQLFEFELQLDQFETYIKPEDTYSSISHIKQQVMKIKRYAISVREILMRISGRKITAISEQCRASLYNLSNHCHMVVHEADSIRDMLNSILDKIDNTLMQRMNETMRILTAFAAIFLPLTLITGIYGMNFHWIPELGWKYGYFYALGLIIACAIFLLLLFKKKKWF